MSSHHRHQLCALLAASAAFPLAAQIRTDGSVGPAAQSLVGPAYTIPQSLGRLAGGNLFHSFSSFNVHAGESANFTTQSTGIENVIGRVTGGSASQINGLIRLTPVSGQPNLFLINPAGVVFGAGAEIDVPGAFHVSTADYLKFAGGKFYADPARASSFSVAAPQSFGFLGTRRASVSVVDGASLLMRSGKPLSLVAGDIDVDQGTVMSAGGKLRVVAVGNAAREIALTGPLAGGPPLTGRVSVVNGGYVSSDPLEDSGHAGSVSIAAGTIAVAGRDASGLSSGVSSTSYGTGKAGKVVLEADERVSVLEYAIVSAENYGSGDAGSVRVSAPNIVVDSQGTFGGISSAAYGVGKGGPVVLSAKDSISVLNRAQVRSGTGGIDDAGLVRLAAPTIVIENSTISGSNLAATGHGGNVEISATNALTVGAGALITSPTFSPGDGGTIKITAGTLSVRGGISTDALPWSSGAGGSIKVEAGALAVVDGGFISSGTHSTGTGGSVDVSVNGLLSLRHGGSIVSQSNGSGDAGHVNVTAGSIQIDGDSDSSYISSDTFGPGRGGTVTVSAATTLTIVNGGLISAVAAHRGDAGSVTVRAADITLDSQDSRFPTGIATTASRGSGSAGSVDVSATGSISVLTGALVTSGTSSAGKAGPVAVSAATVVVDGSDSFGPSTINAKAKSGSSGQTGNVTVAASDRIVVTNGGKLSIENQATLVDPGAVTPSLLALSAPRIAVRGGEITAASAGNVDASRIKIAASERLDLDRGKISTSAQDGNGGPILIQGAGLVSLANAQITTSVEGLQGNGGDIGIRAGGLLMNTGFIQANTKAAGAAGGTVRVDVPFLVPSGGTSFVGGTTPHPYKPGVFAFNVIQAAAPTGVSGSVQTTAPKLDLAGSLAALQAKTIDTGGLGRSPCQIGEGSSFARGGRGGLPASAQDRVQIESPLPAAARPTDIVPPLRLAAIDFGCKL